LADGYVQDLDELMAEYKNGTAGKDKQEVIEEAKEIIAQLRVEIYNVKDPTKKQEIQNKMKQYEREIEASKKSLLMGDYKPKSSTSAEERETKSLQTLEAARKQLEESETLGNDTVKNLAEQRETIERSRNNNKKAQDGLNTSNKLLTRMSKWWRG